jgi:hypothetical protein
MYLELAENTDTMYQPINTNQGTLYVRPDLLSAGLMINKTAQTLKPAAGQLVKKAVPTLIKTAVPGGAGVDVALNLLKKGAAKIKERRDIKKGEAIATQKAAEEAAAAQSAAAIQSSKKTRNLLLIGGGVLAAGVIIYLITRKK